MECLQLVYILFFGIYQDVQILHKVLKVNLISPSLLDIVQFSYNVNFMFRTDSDDSKMDENDANELQGLYYGSDISQCMSVIPFLSITQSNAVVWRTTTELFPMFLESSEESWCKHHRKILRNLHKLPF